ncbi:MAG: DnaD domain protein [Firmicutes bacterium]|nr:DnaD domain protein [Bacillota bacterium]
MATYKFSSKDSIQSTPVANIFIDTYMPVANATFVKVYLYGLRQCFSDKKEVENTQIAKDLSILESDVINAWHYWESVGVVKLNRNDSKASGDFEIKFVDLINMQQPKPEQKSRMIFDKRPNYTSEEISIYIEQNENIRYMFNFAQERLGKLLSSNDIKTLYEFYDWLRLPVEVIIMLIEYCTSIHKRNMKYIESVAVNWADLEINTIEKAEQHIKQLEYKHSMLYKIKKCFGIENRALSDKEKNYINTWIDKMRFDIELIDYAKNLTIDQTGNLPIDYVNSILESWYKQGIRTLQGAQKDVTQRKENVKNKYNKTASKPANASKNKFINFTQRQYDFEELERLAQQKKFNTLK